MWFGSAILGQVCIKRWDQSCCKRESAILRQGTWRIRKELMLHFRPKGNLKAELLLLPDTSCFFPDGFHNRLERSTHIMDGLMHDSHLKKCLHNKIPTGVWPERGYHGLADWHTKFTTMVWLSGRWLTHRISTYPSSATMTQGSAEIRSFLLVYLNCQFTW